MPAEHSGGEPSLEGIVQELRHLKDALGLLGIRQCSYCGKYFLSEHGKSLFEAGELSCFNCIQDWWQRRSPGLTVQERQTIEQKLLRWLVVHHNGKVITHADKMPKPEAISLKMVVGCQQCGGTGTLPGGKACHNCEGRGTEWVVVLRPELE